MILSYDDEDYLSSTQNSQPSKSDNNKKIKNITKEKRKELQENLFAFDGKKPNINIFAAGISDEKDQCFDEDDILKKIAEMKIKNNQDKISNGSSNQNESFSQGEEKKFLSKEMLKIINSPQTKIRDGSKKSQTELSQKKKDSPKINGNLSSSSFSNYLIKNLERKTELDNFWKNKDDNSIIACDAEINNQQDISVSKDYFIKNNIIVNENDDNSSIELSINSGSMETISKKNFIPKIDLIKNSEKNSIGSMMNNLNSPINPSEKEDVNNLLNQKNKFIGNNLTKSPFGINYPILNYYDCSQNKILTNEKTSTKFEQINNKNNIDSSSVRKELNPNSTSYISTNHISPLKSNTNLANNFPGIHSQNKNTKQNQSSRKNINEDTFNQINNTKSFNFQNNYNDDANKNLNMFLPNIDNSYFANHFNNVINPLLDDTYNYSFYNIHNENDNSNMMDHSTDFDPKILSADKDLQNQKMNYDNQKIKDFHENHNPSITYGNMNNVSGLKDKINQNNKYGIINDLSDPRKMQIYFDSESNNSVNPEGNFGHGENLNFQNINETKSGYPINDNIFNNYITNQIYNPGNQMSEDYFLGKGSNLWADNYHNANNTSNNIIYPSIQNNSDFLISNNNRGNQRKYVTSTNSLKNNFIDSPYNSRPGTNTISGNYSGSANLSNVISNRNINQHKFNPNFQSIHNIALSPTNDENILVSQAQKNIFAKGNNSSSGNIMNFNNPINQKSNKIRKTSQNILINDSSVMMNQGKSVKIIGMGNTQFPNGNFIEGLNLMDNSLNQTIKLNKTILNYTDLTNEDLAKNAKFISKDQCGCRFIQKKISENSEFSNNYLFPEIREDLIELCLDPFGNYLVQKLVEFLEDEKVLEVINIIENYFTELGLSPHGTRVIQKLIENLRNKEIMDLFDDKLCDNVIAFSKDANGNHIIQKYLYTIKYPENQFVYDVLTENLYEIATDKHGCCVLQKSLDAADTEQRLCLIEIILKRALEFMSDQYGNYVIQFILSLNDYSTNKKIADLFISDLPYLSKQKFSSNVIEKCYDHSNDEIKLNINNELCKDEKLIGELLVDMYGNYVLQKALQTAKNQNFEKLIKFTYNNFDKLKKVSFGNKLGAKLVSTHKELSSMFINKNIVKNNTLSNNTNIQNTQNNPININIIENNHINSQQNLKNVQNVNTSNIPIINMNHIQNANLMNSNNQIYQNNKSFNHKSQMINPMQNNIIPNMHQYPNYYNQNDIYSNNINIANMGSNDNMNNQHPFMMSVNQGKKQIYNIHNNRKINSNQNFKIQGILGDNYMQMNLNQINLMNYSNGNIPQQYIQQNNFYNPNNQMNIMNNIVPNQNMYR